MKKLSLFILSLMLAGQVWAQPDSAGAQASILSFQVQALQKLVRLTWTVEEGWAYKSFEIERADDGTNFSKVGSRLGISKNSEGGFEYVDATPKKQSTLFYRLRLIDSDGLATYSENREIKLAEALWEVRIKQNPVQSTIDLEVESLSAKQITVAVVTNAGQQILVQTFRLTAGKNNLSLTTNGMRQGLYQLIAEADKERKIISFFKE